MLAGRPVALFFNLSYEACSIIKILSRVHILCCIYPYQHHQKEWY